MASATTPSPVVISASSEYSADWAAWGAFTGSYTDRSWSSSGSVPAWIKVDLGAGNSARTDAYLLNGRYDNLTVYNATAWTLQGSNNDSTWDNIDARSSVSLGNANVMTEFLLSAPSGRYRYFRFWVTAGNCFGEIQILRYVPGTRLPLRGRDRFPRYR
jgi:hypothetical protein